MYTYKYTKTYMCTQGQGQGHRGQLEPLPAVIGWLRSPAHQPPAENFQCTWHGYFYLWEETGERSGKLYNWRSQESLTEVAVATRTWFTKKWAHGTDTGNVQFLLYRKEASDFRFPRSGFVLIPTVCAGHIDLSQTFSGAGASASATQGPCAPCLHAFTSQIASLCSLSSTGGISQKHKRFSCSGTPPNTLN